MIEELLDALEPSDSEQSDQDSDTAEETIMHGCGLGYFYGPA